jgi:hypothetical protein
MKRDSISPSLVSCLRADHSLGETVKNEGMLSTWFDSRTKKDARQKTRQNRCRDQTGRADAENQTDGQRSRDKSEQEGDSKQKSGKVVEKARTADAMRCIRATRRQASGSQSRNQNQQAEAGHAIGAGGGQ